MNNYQPIQELSESLGLALSGNDFAANRLKLAEHINELLASKFEQLVTILYRMDVDEKKLKGLLRLHPDTDAGLIIADLMIGRQAQKIKSRGQTGQRDNNIDENEKW